MSETVGFVGLGGMGSVMAANVLAAGFALRVYNRTAEKAQPLVELGAAQADTPAGTAAGPGSIALTMLTNDAAVEEVTTGKNGLAGALGAGGIHVSLSTIAPDMARRLAEAHLAHGEWYVAAPVFGQPKAAAERLLWIATSGPEDAKTRIRPLLDAMGQGVYDFGDEPGAANTVKLAGNFLFGAAIEAMGEAFTLAQKGGLSRQAVYEMFSETLFACPVYKNYGAKIASEDYLPIGAKPSLIRKDLGLVLAEAQAAQVPMPLASLIYDRLTATVAKGRDDMDWSGFAREVSESAGL